MTDAELMTEVNDHFVIHPETAYWNSLSESERNGVVSMAGNLVLSKLKLSAVPDTVPAVVRAIAEQAVFLARNYESLREGKVINSEKIGDLSTGYALIGNPGFSVFAQLYLETAKAALSPSLLRIGRG